jgi:hypothetical protein
MEHRGELIGRTRLVQLGGSGREAEEEGKWRGLKGIGAEEEE